MKKKKKNGPHWKINFEKTCFEKTDLWEKDPSWKKKNFGTKKTFKKKQTLKKNTKKHENPFAKIKTPSIKKTKTLSNKMNPSSSEQLEKKNTNEKKKPLFEK